MNVKNKLSAVLTLETLLTSAWIYALDSRHY